MKGIRLKEKENELALETFVEENKRKLNETKIVETELKDDDSDIDTEINKTALPSSRTQQVVAETRTKDCVDEALDTHSSELASTITIVPRQEPQPPGIAKLVSSSLPPSTVDTINVHLFPSSSNPSVCLPLQSVVSSTVHNLKIPSQPLPPPSPPPSPPSSPPLSFIPRMPAAMVPTLHASVPINTTVNTATQPVNLIPITAPPASKKKLYNSPPVKMHSSDSIISFASMIASLVGVFKSVHYNADLESATLLDKAIEKLSPNMKESWSFHTLKRSLYAPSLIDFNHWLEDKAEAHERMRPPSNYNRNCFAFLVFKEITCLGNVPIPKLVLNHSARALIMCYCYCTAQNAFSLQITNLVINRTQLQPIPQFKLHLDPRRKTILVGHPF